MKKKNLTIPKQPGMVIISVDNSIFTECRHHIVIVKQGNYQSSDIGLTQVICVDFFLSPFAVVLLSRNKTKQCSGNVFLECCSFLKAITTSN